MKNKAITVCFWCMAGIILLYLAISIVPSIFSGQNIQVEDALSITYDDSLFVRGIALRNEVSVTVSGTPTSVDYKVSDGDRVSIGDTLAVYSNGSVSAADRLAVENIDRQISLLDDCLSATSQYDLKTLDARTKDAISDYLSAGESYSLSSAKETGTNVLSYLIKRDIKANGDKDYYRQIRTNCIESRNILLQSDNAKQSAVYAARAGFFSSAYDGFESLTLDDLKDKESGITPRTLRNALATPPETRPANYIGKLQHFSFWNYVCTVPEAYAETFTKGSTWTIRFNTAAHGVKNVNMNVVSVSGSVDGEVAITFECTFFDEGLYSLRICDAQIILRSYSGFRVRKDAIRVLNGESGVYVLSGAKLVFKPIKILFMNDDSSFAVVLPAVEKSTRTLIVNDVVVIGGKDIEDGKVVNIN